MSDWEDFCDSNGWNIGSEDDYDRFLDSLEGKPEVSTTSSLSISSIKEYDSDVTIGELVIDLEAHALEDHNIEFICEPWGWELDPAAELSDTCLDGITYNHKHLHYFIIQVRSNVRGEYCVSLRLFIDAIRTLGIPVQTCNCIVAWDNTAQCLDVCGGLVEKYAYQKRRNLIECHTQENYKLLSFLERAKSTDHGFKPVIIPRDDVARLNRAERVAFLDPTMLSIEELKDCTLAYFNKNGQPKCISMSDILSVTSLLVTRIGTFWANGEKVRPINGVATLLSNAYAIAKKSGDFGITFALDPSYYFQKSDGTIFEPAYSQITVEQARSAPQKMVYIPDGCHPLGNSFDHENARLVTTYAQYEDARRKLESYRGR